MKLFKPYTLNWWQLGIFKLALLSIGVAIGAYWHEFFEPLLAIFIVVGVISSAYMLYIYFKQMR